MSTEVFNNLREAIHRAEAEELRIADRLSAMVCERDHKELTRAGTFEESGHAVNATFRQATDRR